MKTTHSIIVCITLFVSSISFVFGYNKAKDGTYYADFNGDGKHDIFLYDKTKGTGVVWGWDENKWKTLWENNTFRKTWEVHLGDFDGNGKSISRMSSQVYQGVNTIKQLFRGPNRRRFVFCFVPKVPNGPLGSALWMH